MTLKRNLEGRRRLARKYLKILGNGLLRACIKLYETICEYLVTETHPYT